MEPPAALAAGFAREHGPEETVRQHRRGRRAMWVSVGAVAALSAVSFPIVSHFAHRVPTPVRVPDKVAGLTIDHSTNAASTADYLRSAIAASLNLTSSVGAVYTDGGTGSLADAHSVIFVGGTAPKGTNTTQVNALLSLLDDSADGVDDMASEDPGSVGGLMRCGETTATTAPGAAAQPDTAMAVCAFANKGSVGMALFPSRTVPAAADLMRQMRPSFIKQ